MRHDNSLATRAALLIPCRAVLKAWGVGVLMLLAAGCGGDDMPVVEEGVIVKGRILSDGKTLVDRNAPPGTGSGQVSLVPADQSAKETEQKGYPMTMINEDGTFVFEGAGKGVPPGKYRLIVAGPDASGVPADATVSEDAGPITKAFSVAKSPIEVTIPDNLVGKEHDLGTIDLAKYMKK